VLGHQVWDEDVLQRFQPARGALDFGGQATRSCVSAGIGTGKSQASPGVATTERVTIPCPMNSASKRSANAGAR
jgi:hypothetical protein